MHGKALVAVCVTTAQYSDRVPNRRRAYEDIEGKKKFCRLSFQYSQFDSCLPALPLATLQDASPQLKIPVHGFLFGAHSVAIPIAVTTSTLPPHINIVRLPTRFAQRGESSCFQLRPGSQPSLSFLFRQMPGYSALHQFQEQWIIQGK